MLPEVAETLTEKVSVLTGGPGADRFSGGAGKDVATDFTATQGDTSDGTIP